MYRILLIGLGIALAAIAGIYIYIQSGDSSERIAQKTKPAPPRQSWQASPPSPSSQSPQSSPAAPSAVIHPTIDHVRIAKDGMAVISGYAQPASDNDLLNRDKTLGSAKANAQGAWTILIEKPLKPGELSLRIRSRLTNGEILFSRQSLAIVVPARESQSEALALVSEPGKASRVVQSPDQGIATEMGELLVENIDYDDKGRVIVSGRADKNTVIRAYMDNRYIGEIGVDAKTESWELVSEDAIAPGIYTMRVDQVDDTGTVLARLALPFKFASQEEIAKLRDNPGNVMIQPGHNLWTIARNLYGKGVLYTVIYLNNKDRILDPDLIFPGQVFTTPDL